MKDDRYKPKRIMSRMCNRHEFYVPQCPKCNEPVLCEEHMDKNRNLRVMVPIYKKKWTNKNKY